VIGIVLIKKQKKLIFEQPYKWEQLKNEHLSEILNIKTNLKLEVKELHHEKEEVIRIIQAEKDDWIQKKLESEKLFNIDILRNAIRRISLEKLLDEHTSELNRRRMRIKRLFLVQSLLEQKIVQLKDEILYQSFGFYDIKYDLENSAIYKERLAHIRKRQKDAVKQGMAVNSYTDWYVQQSRKKGEVMTKRQTKMTLRSFNNECDVIIQKVKFNNLDAVEKKIRLAREQLNKLNKSNDLEITELYMELKLEELFLNYEYIQKKEEEKENLRRLNEQIQEEKKAKKELEERLKVLRKEEKHFENALQNYRNQLLNADKEKTNKILNEISKTELDLSKIYAEKEVIDYRVRNGKAGFVYIVSNIGSFGEGVYKIGMTRRLNPDDRLKELGGPSVPFAFDQHAMIFSDDAPALENTLHKRFDHLRINKVNPRKEYFRVSLEEIENEVNTYHNGATEFIKLASAKEFRETLAKEKSIN